MSLTEQYLSSLPDKTLERLRRADQVWQQYRQGNAPQPHPDVVTTTAEALDSAPDWDVVICGGTLGILMGAALVQQGWRVALLERGQLRGRDQEWNISRRELRELVDLGLLTEAELENAIATEYNPGRIHFHEGPDFWVRDVLNVGVDPVYLLETLKQKFLAAGGELIEYASFESVIVYNNGVQMKYIRQQDTSPLAESLTARLLLDAMGHFSPIVRHVRGNQKPDAVCLVVGTCAQGYEQNETGDLIASFTPIRNQCQYFWEAFPARDGRTTYLFTYVDAHPDRLGLEALFEEYFQLLPTYQNIDLDQLEIQRALFGFFPCYRQSPLRYPYSRLLPIGDSSGSQSPLSFGGFGAMIRHLKRLTRGIDEALRCDQLGEADLKLLQPYQPNLSVTWLFQRSMSVGMNQSLAPNQINELLSSVFQQMASLGDDVLKPFMQDVVKFPALTKTLLKATAAQPLMVTQIVPQVGLGSLLDWMRHYGGLSLYSALHALDSPLSGWIDQLPPEQRYRWHRWQDAWQYGSGGDYES